MPSATRTRIVRQKKKGPIDPGLGERVRALRVARGLSQADLAGKDFSKGFISLVETGRTRMSMRAAEIVAGRLGVALAQMYRASNQAEQAVEIELLRAESQLAAGESQRALEAAGRLRQRTVGNLRSRLDRLEGQALLAQGRAREAIARLDEAARAFRAIPDPGGLARTFLDLAYAHARLEEHGEALHLGLEAEHVLQGDGVIDRILELKVLSFLAGAFVTVGDFSAADLRSERALALAEDVSDRRAVASLYQGLSTTRQEQGDYEAALLYARKGLDAYEALGNERAVGSSWNSIGWVYVQRRQFARAEEALTKAEQLALEQSNGRLLAYVLQTRAQLEAARGNFDAAIELAQRSIDHPEASDRCRALSQLVRAQALGNTKADGAQVTAAFQEAFRALESQGRRLLAGAYQAHFDAMVARGETAVAITSAKRALDLMRPTAG
jgi:tetratricopeptide (TPR) repeat protein